MFDLIQDILARDIADRKRAKDAEDMTGKGELNGRCNRTACGSRRNVVWWNRGSRAYYCPKCACEINAYRPKGMEVLCVDTTTLTPKYQPGDRVRILARFGIPERTGKVRMDHPQIPCVTVELDTCHSAYDFEYDSLEPLC